MDSSRDLVLTVGLDRLFHEILEAALSNHGWRVLDLERDRGLQDSEVELVLVAGSGSVQDVLGRLREVRAGYPTSKILLLGASASDSDMVGFIKAGASAYVAGNEGLSQLVEALQMVRNHQSLSSGRVTQLVIHTIRRLSEHAHSTPEARLTLREKEIFRLIQEGLSNKEIANRLRITPNTVKNHVHHLLEKLRVRSRHEAAWLQPSPSKTRTGTGA
jgi:DNA-binding NarL/FixJ family response regulator